MREVFQVNAAGGDVRGNDEFDGAVFGALHNAVAAGLIKTAVKRLYGKSAGAHGFRDFVDFDASAGKADGKLGFFDFENAGERSQAMRARHNVGDLRHARRFFRGVFLDDDVFRVLEMLVGDFKNALGQRRRKERRLVHFGKRCGEFFEFFCKTHVEHFVGFVHHEELDMGEVKRSAVQMIKRAAGRGNDDVNAAL